MRRQGDDRHEARPRVRLELPRRLPAVQHGQAHVHQDQIGRFRLGQLHAALAVHRQHDLVAFALQPAREHVAVHLVVFDQENLGHGVVKSIRHDAGAFSRTPRAFLLLSAQLLAPARRGAVGQQVAHLMQQHLARVAFFLRENLLDKAIEPQPLLAAEVMGRQNHDGNRSPLIVLAHLGGELEAIHFGPRSGPSRSGWGDPAPCTRVPHVRSWPR